MFFDKPEDQVRLSDSKAEGEPSTFWERTQAAHRDMIVSGNHFGRETVVEEAYENRIKAITNAGIKHNLQNPSVVKGMLSQEERARGITGDAWSYFDTQLKELAEKHPDKADIIGASRPIKHDAVKLDAAAEKRAESTSGNYGGIPGTGVVADMAGGMAGMLQDPVNAFTMLLGPLGPTGRGAKAVLTMAAKQGLANAGVEAVLQPVVQAWRRDAGRSYGWSEGAANVAMAGALGFGMDAGIRGAYRVGQSRAGRSAILDDKGGVIGYEGADAAAARAKSTADLEKARAEIAARQKIIDDIPDEVKQKAEAGDVDALEAIIKATGGDQDPSVRGALNHMRMAAEDRIRLNGVDDGASERAMAQMLRNTIDPNEPPPAHIDVTPTTRAPSLSDFSELPKGIDGNQHYRNLEIDGKPVSFRALDPKDLGTDPETFQFKGGRDPGTGAGNTLDRLQFDPALKGRVIAFERADGKIIIADGHDRLKLATRMNDPDIKLDGFVFREADGWTVEQVRAEASRKNITEGSGDLMDVAAEFRARPEIIDSRMSMDTAFMEQARNLSRLSDQAFADVMAGSVDPKHGALVGELVADKAQHSAVLEKLTALNPQSDRQARLAIGEATRRPLSADATATLLGAEIAPTAILGERAAVLAGALDEVRANTSIASSAWDQDGRLDVTAALQSETIARAIEHHASKPGLVSDWLNTAAKAVAEGQPQQRATDAFLRRIQEQVDRGGVKSLDGDSTVRVSPTADDEPIRLAALAGSDAATGKSMQGFYGSRTSEGIVPKNLRKLLEKIDKDSAKPVKVTELETPSGMKGYGKDGGSFDKNNTGFTVFPLTEKVKQSVKEEGQALFALRSPERALDVIDRAAQMRQFGPVGVRGVRGVLDRIFDPQMRTPGQIEAEPFDLKGVRIVRRSNETIDLREVRTIQNNVSIAVVKNKIALIAKGDEPFLSVFRYRDQLFVNDGNHGITAARALGRTNLKAEVIDIEDRASAGDQRLSPSDAASGRSLDVSDQYQAASQNPQGVQGRQAGTNAAFGQMRDQVSPKQLASKVEELSAHLNSVLSEARAKPRELIDDVSKDGKLQTERLREELQDEIRLAMSTRPLDMAPEARKARAEQMGFDTGTIWYHGTNQPLDVIKPGMRDPGAWFTTDKMNASNYARGEEAQLYSVYLRVSNPMLVEAADDGAGGFVPMVAGKRLDMTDNVAIVREAKSRGHDAVHFPDGNFSESGNTMVVFDAKQIRDTDAEFDPAKSSSPQLMAALQRSDMPSLADTYQRYITQGRDAVDAAMPGMGKTIDDFAQANPDIAARIAEALGAPERQAEASQMIQQAVPAFTNPRVIDASRPTMMTPEANARMAEIRQEIDRTVQMLPPDVRIRVEDELVFNFGNGDKRLDGLWDGYDRLVYVALSSGDPVRAARHEVVHALRRSGLMTDAEFSTLYAFAEKLKLRGAYDIDAQYKETYTQAYQHRGNDYVEQLLREETVANMFSDYSLNGRRFGDVSGGSVIDRLIDKVVSFMKDIRDMLGGMGFRHVHDVFESIESGAMARRGQGGGDERLGMFAGEKAQTADIDALAKAKEAEAAGVPRDTIWKDHGWFKGVDGKWRFEIDDGASGITSQFRNEPSGSGQWAPNALVHDELYKAYPDTKALFMQKQGASGGAFDQKTGTIFAGGNSGPGLRSTALHEMQHALQSIEGFNRGGSPRQFSPEDIALQREKIASSSDDGWSSTGAAGDLSDTAIAQTLYSRLAGEAEARTVQKRMDLTPAQRRARPPWLDYDVPEAQQIVRGVDGPNLATSLEDAARDMHLKDVVEACRS